MLGATVAAALAVLSAGPAAAVAAPDDAPSPASVAELAQTLGSEHVLVEQTRGSGDTAGATARLERLVDRLPLDTYVAVVDAPPDVDAGTDASAYLATALSRRIGRPGLYVVSADGISPVVRAVGTPWDQTLLDLQVFADRDAVEKASGDAVLSPTVATEAILQTVLTTRPRSSGGPDVAAGLPAPVVRDLADRERALEPHDRPDLQDVEDATPWSASKRWMVGTTVGVGLLAVLLQSIAGWPGWRSRDPQPVRKRRSPTATGPAHPLTPPDLEAERAAADRDLTALATRLTDAPPGTHHDHATLAREAAEPLLSSPDVLDVVGAGVLARAGLRELTRGARRAGQPLRLCFFDPRHTSAAATVDWAWGDAEVAVPVCASCRRDLGRHDRPAALVVSTRGRLRPYYEGTTVWARTGFGSLSADLADLVEQVTDERRRSR